MCVVKSSSIPGELEVVFSNFRTCEMATLAKDGTPITWPTEPFYQSEKKKFLITTSIGMAQKAFNIRRNPKVSLFFSTPTGCGLVDPPTVLVQGDARAPDEILTSFTGEFGQMGHVAFQRQPAAELYSSNPLTRYLFDWYYMRILIYVAPRRILWWDHGDYGQPPHELEVGDVV
jgi:Pyridoxamine 5'-phosphate oxidase